MDCFIPNFKLKYEDLENIKADRVSTAIFNLHQTSEVCLGHPVVLRECGCSEKACHTVIAHFAPKMNELKVSTFKFVR